MSNKRPKLVELAEALGVNVGTISRALNDKPGVSDKLRAKIKAKAQEVSYRPNIFARTLQTNRSFQIGVIAQVRMHAFFDNSFWGRILSGIEEESRKSEYELLFSGGHETEIGIDPNHIPRFVEQHQVDGVILVNAVSPELKKVIIDHHIPCVQVDFSEHDEFDAIVIEQKASMKKLLKSILELGHTELLFLGAPERHENIKARRDGFHEAVTQANCTPHELHYTESTDTAESSKLQEALLKQLRAHPNITAICCENDSLALRAKTALLHHGLTIPDQMSISGFDNLSFSELIYPSLTTVQVSKRLVGQTAARRLIEQIESKDEEDWTPLVVTYPAIPIMRQSTSSPRKGPLKL
jgi:DNA-binding LacI/PurR family transcriptional regulator